MRRKGGESSSLKPACGGEREKMKCYVEGKRLDLKGGQ